MTAVVIPVRGFATGKSRLVPALGDGGRRRLVRYMADAALDATSGFDVRVVTPDPEVATWAIARGIRVVPDPGDGLNTALEAARSEALLEGAQSVLVLFADLPHVTGEDVEALLELDGSLGVALAPDTAGTGTNALHAGRESRLRYSFGPGSFKAHLAQAPGARIVRRRGLSADVDDASSLPLLPSS